jgi:hypothetical protein
MASVDGVGWIWEQLDGIYHLVILWGLMGFKWNVSWDYNPLNGIYPLAFVVT